MIASGPAAGRRLRIPEPDEYVAQLPAPVRELLDAFYEKYSDVDPTDGNSFGKALMTERGRYPIELSSEQYDTYYAWMAKTKAMSEQLIKARGRLLGIPLNGTDKEGRRYLLTDFDGAKPRYTFTQNREAAVSTAASFVRRNAAFDSIFGPDVDGSGFYAIVDDDTEVGYHREFKNEADTAYRLTIVDDGSVGGHSTYVAGTIGARGADTRAMGMAPEVHIYSTISASAGDMALYGMNWPGRPERAIVGNVSMSWSSSSYAGVYRYPANTWDQMHCDTPYYLHFASAGNEGSAYFTIAEGIQTAKNTVTVGSVSDASRDANGIRTGGANISSWSSRGPMRDGRIKPDIVANGEGLYTTDGTNGYKSVSGTSFSSPNAAGSAVLLQDYFNKRFPGRYMRAPTLKALIINTAEDRGNPGPDYHYGWGLMNVLEAGRIIKKYAANPASRVLVEDTLTEGQTTSLPYTYDGSGPIRVTISWYDLPGPGTDDPANTTPVLVNDLNLRLIAPNSSAHLPYVMPYVIGSGTTSPFDPSLRGANAVRGTNFTDNSIQVLIAAPQAGEYTVEISHAGTLTGGSQKYSLVVSGMTAGAAPPPVITSNTTQGYTTAEMPIEVLGTGFMLGGEVTLKRDGSQPVRPYGVEVSRGRIFARLDTSDMEKGYWDVVVRNPDGQEAVSGTPFLLPVPQTLYSNNFNSASGLTLEGGWAVGSPNQSAVGGPGSAYSAPNVLGTYLNGNYPNNLSTIYAKLPAISTLNMKNIEVNFRQWLGKKASDRVYIWLSDGSSGSGYQIASATDIDENEWSLQSRTFSSSYENKPTVYIKFSLQSDAADVSYGMNIDDLEVTGEGYDKVPPVFTSEAVTSAVAAEAYTYSVSVSDGDTTGAGLAWTGGTLPDWLSLQPTGDGTTAALSGTPAATDVGDHDVVLRVTDGDYVTWQTFTIRVSPEGHVPGMPTGLIAALAGTQVDLTWDAFATAESYNIKRSTTSGSGYVTIGSPTSTSFSDTTGTQGETYYYVVSAVNTVGESDNSTEVSAYIPFVLPFADDFESRTVGALDGQNGWIASSAFVQTNVSIDAHAVSIESEDGSVQREFADGQTNVWTDMQVQAVFSPEDISPESADVTVVLYFNAAGNPVAYDGTDRVVYSGRTVSSGQWVRVTINSDYVAKTWDLYINGTSVATGLGFYNTAVAGYNSLQVKGGSASQGAKLDEVSVGLISPPDIIENVAPIADAGEDQTVTDVDNSGSATVTLDGSASSDDDGTIVSYVWTLGGTEIATGVSPPVSLAVGTHTITLTVTDNDGATDAATVTITVVDSDEMDNDWEILHFGDTTSSDGTTDTDGDGATDYEEFIAGTDPNDPEKFLRIESITWNGSNQPEIIWTSAQDGTTPERKYRLERTEDLSSGTWSNLIEDISPAGSTTKQSDTTPQTDHGYYRIMVY